MTRVKIHWKFLNLGLLSFAAFLWEVAAVVVEAFVYGTPDFREWSLAATLVHWSVTGFLWLGSGVFLYRSAKKQGFDFLEAHPKPSVRKWILVFLMLCVCVAVSFVQWDYRFKPLAEWAGKFNAYADGGAIAFVFQYLYYLIESLLVLLVIVFGQRFGDVSFSFKFSKWIPWGGLMCGLTWGLAHILTKDLGTGITLWLLTVLYGVAYNLLNKNFWISYVAVALMFIL